MSQFKKHLQKQQKQINKLIEHTRVSLKGMETSLDFVTKNLTDNQRKKIMEFKNTNKSTDINYIKSKIKEILDDSKNK